MSILMVVDLPAPVWAKKAVEGSAFDGEIDGVHGFEFVRSSASGHAFRWRGSCGGPS